MDADNAIEDPCHIAEGLTVTKQLVEDSSSFVKDFAGDVPTYVEKCFGRNWIL